MLFPLRSKCFIFVPGILENMFFICGAERGWGEEDGIGSSSLLYNYTIYMPCIIVPGLIKFLLYLTPSKPWLE